MKGASGICPWNTGDHRRKFMKAKGKIVNGATLSAVNDVYFWGEWEPESLYTRISSAKSRPLYIHSPLKPNPHFVKSVIAGGCASSHCNSPQHKDDDERGCINTDPFVFGDYFVYSNCRQTSKNGTIHRQTAYLEIGSLILFGSVFLHCGKWCFGLDTVFVVDEKRQYTPATYKTDLAGFMPPYFEDAMLFELWELQTVQFTCYHGATFRHPCNGMYSFVPCKVGSAGKGGFIQPVFQNSDFAALGYKYDVLRDRCNRNFYISLRPMRTTDDDVKKVWIHLKDIVKKQGFCEGVELQLL